MYKWLLQVKLVCAGKGTGSVSAGTKNSFWRVCVFSVKQEYIW